ncbi:uncharacterized protein N7496_007304 [Penicillium cataractarum]|uniref:Uncharacterized protein n=1 Tax=Penicillium cataractarum TaxID=2100454 RepID=A0A9W9S356_9EURO|nr:uncharacterized protein N7496_007304 [Penicillium cataractarum]KAJ5371212.1 hypothetical protein N7496_007304 [Penicillium cataractarum]
MNQLSDRPAWDGDVFDTEVVTKWKQATFDTNLLISEEAWGWCIKELRDKLVDLRENCQIHIRVVDTGLCVCKADAETLDSLSVQRVRSGLIGGAAGTTDFRLAVLNVVDAFLFRLVY